VTIYNQGVFRGQGSGGAGLGFDVPGSSTGDALVPEPLSTSIIQELPKQCAALSLMKKTVLSTKTERMPVLDVLPIAYWVGGDTGMKQTSQQEWKNVVLVVEELATIIPIPQAYLDDADVPIWDEVQPRMVEAAGNLIDQAIFWDIAKPSTWGTSIVGGAVNAGNVSLAGGTTDFGTDITGLADTMSQTGYNVNGFVGRPGLNWHLAGLRSSQGIPIYQSVMGSDMSSSQGLNGNLYGYPITMPDNGAFQSTDAQLIMGDFSKAIIGVRQDISFKLFTEGVISNDSGAVVLNLMQQDAVAMRMVMRLAYATVNPVTIMQPNKGITTRWPFAVLATSGGRLIGSGTGSGARVDTAVGATVSSSVFTDTSIVASDLGRSFTASNVPAGAVITGVTPGTGFTANKNASTTGTVTATVGALVSLGNEVPGTGLPSLGSSPAEKRDAARRLLAEADAMDPQDDADDDGEDATPAAKPAPRKSTK
jgi:HK97 family phage major capsid protein